MSENDDGNRSSEVSTVISSEQLYNESSFKLSNRTRPDRKKVDTGEMTGCHNEKKEAFVFQQDENMEKQNFNTGESENKLLIFNVCTTFPSSIGYHTTIL
jgi:hypothetical protein